jgi:TolB protein
MEFTMDRPTTRLGRGAANDVILEDSQASRQHAEISKRGEQFFIRDLQSMNGTFVNGKAVREPRLLRPGDEVQIGDTVLTVQPSAPAAMAPHVTDWEAELWEDQPQAVAEDRRPWFIIGLLVAFIALLLVGVILIVLQVGRPTPEPTTVAGESLATATTPLEVVATATSPAPAQPTVTPIVDLTITVPKPTVKPLATAEGVSPPSVPTPLPVAPGAIEQLPAVVATAFPGVMPEQLPEVLAQQIQALPPQQVRAMVGALFPGVDPERLPGVIAASFPGLGEQDIRGLLDLVFPGQAVPLPTLGPVEGRMALGIYDPDRERYDLYLANAAEDQVTRLREDAGDPDFSPDGLRLVFHSWGADTAGLRLMNLDGSDDQKLTGVDKDGYPSFAPDGERISFFNADNKTIHVINRDGEGRRDIGQGEYPAWSPTGDQIVYRGCVSGGKCGLVVANADGSDPRQITTYANDAAPRWSPNGGQIAFMSDRDGNWEIYVVNSDGSWLRRITLNQATDIMPVWSPSGLRVAFRSDRDGRWGVWVTSGIGGGAFKMFDAASGKDWMWARMDWVR